VNLWSWFNETSQRISVIKPRIPTLPVRNWLDSSVQRCMPRQDTRAQHQEAKNGIGRVKWCDCRYSAGEERCLIISMTCQDNYLDSDFRWNGRTFRLESRRQMELRSLWKVNWHWHCLPYRDMDRFPPIYGLCSSSVEKQWDSLSPLKAGLFFPERLKSWTLGWWFCPPRYWIDTLNAWPCPILLRTCTTLQRKG
jgi:hypothetical protein